jgi:hypothetical protein
MTSDMFYLRWEWDGWIVSPRPGATGTRSLPILLSLALRGDETGITSPSIYVTCTIIDGRLIEPGLCSR